MSRVARSLAPTLGRRATLLAVVVPIMAAAGARGTRGGVDLGIAISGEPGLSSADASPGAALLRLTLARSDTMPTGPPRWNTKPASHESKWFGAAIPSAARRFRNRDPSAALRQELAGHRRVEPCTRLGRPGSGNGAPGQPRRSGDGIVDATVGCSSGDNEADSGHPVMIGFMKATGSILIDVDGRRLDARMVDWGGRVLDHFAIVKERREVPGNPE